MYYEDLTFLLDIIRYWELLLISSTSSNCCSSRDVVVHVHGHVIDYYSTLSDLVSAAPPAAVAVAAVERIIYYF